MLLQLPPNYQYGGIGTKKAVFHGTTVEAALDNMVRCGRMQASADGTRYFRCIYCERDPYVIRTPDGLSLYHPRHLCQIDHIVPFSKIAANPNGYYYADSYDRAAERGFVAARGWNIKPTNGRNKPQKGDPMDIEGPDGAASPLLWNKADILHMTLLYNDVNNLHAVCTGHNQHKGGQDNYLGLSSDEIFATYRGQPGH